MAEMYNTAATCSSSSTPPPGPENDDISLFLRQILHKGKQMQCLTPSHIPPPEIQHPPVQTAGISISDRIPGLFSPSGGLFPANVSSSVGTIDNDFDDYDCESEEGFENLMEEMAAKPNPTPRNSSKRSRAAEVHNLSEKRRRSRINEKMKALQKLIPNSNKTDKASMLDEAIEYLKQLQLQVQMLTMRNGLNLYSMCGPGVLQPNQLPNMRMGLNEGNGSPHMNMTGPLPMSQETLANPMLSSLPIQCTNPTQPSVSNLSHMINPETSFQLESSFQTQHVPFQFHKPSEDYCREEMLSRPQINIDHTGTNPLEFQMEVKASILRRDRLEGVQPTSAGCEPILPPLLDRTRTRRKLTNDGVFEI